MIHRDKIDSGDSQLLKYVSLLQILPLRILLQAASLIVKYSNLTVFKYFCAFYILALRKRKCKIVILLSNAMNIKLGIVPHYSKIVPDIHMMFGTVQYVLST